MHRSWSVLATALTVAGLGACAEPSFQFRGYSDLSSCRQVLDTEIANGSGFESAYDSTDPDSPGHITELAGTLFDVPVRIEVTCTIRNRPAAIHYIATARNPEQTGNVFVTLATALEAAYGSPEARYADDSRTLFFLCTDPAPVTLEEWQVAEDEHEVYVAVNPAAASCLSAGP